MNRKLKKYLDDADRMEKRILEMQEQLKAVRSAQELEENNEIVKSFRGMKLNGRELYALLCGLQDGSVTFQRTEDGNGTFWKKESGNKVSQNPAADMGNNDVSDMPDDRTQDNQKIQSEESEDKGNEAEMDENA